LRSYIYAQDNEDIFLPEEVKKGGNKKPENEEEH
jgi:hypothetical protein